MIVCWRRAVCSFTKSEFHRTCFAEVFLNKCSSKHVCTDASQRLCTKASIRMKRTVSDFYKAAL